MSAEHTPGPWDYDAHGIHSNGSRLVVDPCITESNARLISAAPDLLAVLEGLADDLPELDDDTSPLQGSTAVEVLVNHWDALKAAIAKARGQA